MVAPAENKKYYIHFKQLNKYLHKIVDGVKVVGTENLGHAVLMDKAFAETVLGSIKEHSDPSGETKGENYQDCEIVRFDASNKEYAIIKLTVNEDGMKVSCYLKEFIPQVEHLVLEPGVPINVLLFHDLKTARGFLDKYQSGVVSCFEQTFTELFPDSTLKKENLTFEVVPLWEEIHIRKKMGFNVYHPETSKYLAQLKENGDLVETDDQSFAFVLQTMEVGQFWIENPEYLELGWIHKKTPNKN